MRALLQQGTPAEEAGLVPGAAALQRFSERGEAELLAAVPAAPAQHEEEEEGEDGQEEGGERAHQRALAAAAVAEKAALAAALGRLVTSQARPALLTASEWLSCHVMKESVGLLEWPSSSCASAPC